MFKKTLGWLVVAGCLILPLGSTCWGGGFGPSDSWRGSSQKDSVCQGSCGGGCGPCPSEPSPPTYTPPSHDYEAERRAEEQRKRDAELEQQRIDADNKRLLEEAEKKAKFLKDRDAAADTLRGSTGIRITPNMPGGTGLRDAPHDTGLRGSKAASNNDQGKQATAWKQLHCASYIAGYALKALQNSDMKEFNDMSVQALKAWDGQRPDMVECPSAPPMPNLNGGAVDMDHLQSNGKQILERANKIAERMKKTEAKKPEAQPATPPPANETDIERTVRVQRELNRVNERPIKGNQQEINQQEKDRKELTKLILENEKLTSVDFVKP